jgi:glycosyltransferase involved in cell wall biosynthesis
LTAAVRIVQFVENLARGGLERMAVDLALELSRRGHQVSFVCLHDPGALAAEAEAAGLSVTALRKPPGFSLKTLYTLVRHFRSLRPDVVHTHNGGVHHYAAVAARLAGVQCLVCTRHGPVSSTGVPYNERWFRMVSPWTDRIFHVSEHTRRHLIEAGGLPLERSEVLHNGILLERYTSRPAQVGAHYPSLRFGTLGRMVPVKGHSILLEAFATVAAALPGATLRITGGGVLQPELEAQARQLGLQDRVFIEDLNPDAPGVLANLDAFVFPSLNEGLPLVILEAMACGLPIVSTLVGGVPEVAPDGEAAWYCPPGDAAALAGRMLEAAGSLEELQRRGAAARSIAIARHGFDRMVDRYETAYRTIVAGKPS